MKLQENEGVGDLPKLEAMLSEPPGEGLCVGIPTLHRYDLLDKVLDSVFGRSLVPDQICVIDNGGGYRNRFGRRVEIVRPGYNLGVAASWNAIYQRYTPSDVVILNDDVAVGPRTLESMHRTPGWFVTALCFACFLMRRRVGEYVGLFDETLWPVYCVDSDYEIRMRKYLKMPRSYSTRDRWEGIRHIPLEPQSKVSHLGGGSQTKLPWMKPWTQRTRARMKRKWRWRPGKAQQTTYEEPYDGNLEDPFELHSQLCWGNETYRPYMEAIAGLASQCDHAVELVGDIGRFTMCLLRANVDTVICFAPDRNPDWDYLPRLAKQRSTALEMRSSFDPDVTMPETDFLLISEHEAMPLKRHFYRQHCLVRRYLAFVGEDNAACPARDEFEQQEENRWQRVHHHNGLTILGRI